MILGKNGEYILLGLTSFGYECAAKDVLGLYTDVSHYLDWLQKKMNVNLSGGTPIEQTSSTTSSTVTNTKNTTKPPLEDFPWNDMNTTDGNINVKPIGNAPTIIIYLNHSRHPHRHHHLLKNNNNKKRKTKRITRKHHNKRYSKRRVRNGV